MRSRFFRRDEHHDDENEPSVRPSSFAGFVPYQFRYVTHS